MFLNSLVESIVISEKGKQSPKLKVMFREKHLLENVLAAISVARYFALTWEEIALGLLKLKPYRHRFEKIERQGVVYIDDSYNASPYAVKVALAHLPAPKSKGKRIAVLGAMKELGAFCASSHREVGEWATRFANGCPLFGL